MDKIVLEKFSTLVGMLECQIGMLRINSKYGKENIMMELIDELKELADTYDDDEEDE